MKKLVILLLVQIFFVACSESEPTDSEHITIGTFNIAWLGDGIEDTKPRTDSDYKLVFDVIKNSNVDILGLQEIENNDALNKVIGNSKEYKYYVCNSGGSQNLAMIYKSGIDLNFISNYSPLEVEPNRTRPGAIFSFRKNNLDAIIMIVHFKSTSRYDSTSELQDESRRIRAKQAEKLSYWIDSMLTDSPEKDLFILGDFNDYPTRKNNATLTPLEENQNIEFLTYDMKSCKFEYLGSIDHIVIASNLQKRYLQNSVRMYDLYSAFSDTEVEKISDHCPVLATFNVQMKDDD